MEKNEFSMEQMDSVTGGREHIIHVKMTDKVCPQCGTALNRISNPIARTVHYSCPNCHFKGTRDQLTPEE